MATLGHGISEAVRNHIPVWMDDATINILFDAYKKSGGVLDKVYFARRMRNSDNWVRKSRKNTSTGYERLYHCKTMEKATLIVHSPESDMSANSYVFKIDAVPVAGGKTKLKSTHVSTTVSKSDKTGASAKDVQFVRFTEEELRKMTTEARFGDGFAHLELERES